MTKNEKLELLILYEKFVYTFRHSEFVVDGHAEKVRKIIVDSINATPEGDCHPVEGSVIKAQHRKKQLRRAFRASEV